jgi:hypothetical protein
MKMELRIGGQPKEELAEMDG